MTESAEKEATLTTDEIRKMADDIRQKIVEQNEMLEAIPLVQAIRSGEIELPVEIQLLAHAFFYIDKTTSDILSRQISDSSPESASHLPHKKVDAKPRHKIKKLRA